METWTLTIDAPMGKIPATLTLSADGQSGEMSGKSGSGPVGDLTNSGGTLSWTTKIDRPMPMTLTFKGARDGDQLSGKVKFGLFASGSFEGTRVSDAA